MDSMRRHHGTEASWLWDRAAVILERLEMAREHLSMSLMSDAAPSKAKGVQQKEIC